MQVCEAMANVLRGQLMPSAAAGGAGAAAAAVPGDAPGGGEAAAVAAASPQLAELTLQCGLAVARSLPTFPEQVRGALLPLPLHSSCCVLRRALASAWLSPRRPVPGGCLPRKNRLEGRSPCAPLSQGKRLKGRMLPPALLTVLTAASVPGHAQRHHHHHHPAAQGVAGSVEQQSERGAAIRSLALQVRERGKRGAARSGFGVVQGRRGGVIS